MPRIVRCALIQASNALSTERPLAQIRKAMLDKHMKLIEQAARKKTQILCLQELFYGPYFCAEQNARWYELTERVPEGPTTQLMQKVAAKHKMAMVVPVYEEHMPGVYFNTAAVIDADGRYLGKYRKHHIPHCHPGFWEKFYFTPGDLGYPVFNPNTRALACTSAMTATFRKGRAFWDCMGRKLFSILRRPWPAYRSICGSWNSRPMRSPTDTLLGPSIAWEQRNRGASVSSTVRVIFAIRAERSWPRPAATKTKWS